MMLEKKRNLMHEKTKGEIIVYMDDDDYYPPQSVQIRVSHLKKELENDTHCVFCTTVPNFDINQRSTIDDKKYQVITASGDAKYDSDSVISMSFITRDGETVVYANHDGIPVRTGDSTFFIWTIVRPA